jgi:hypothetical protein
VEEVPCWKLLAAQGPVCYLGINTALNCRGCTSYDEHPTPSDLHWEVWAEIRGGTATRSDSEPNSGGRAK